MYDWFIEYVNMKGLQGLLSGALHTCIYVIGSEKRDHFAQMIVRYSAI